MVLKKHFFFFMLYIISSFYLKMKYEPVIFSTGLVRFTLWLYLMRLEVLSAKASSVAPHHHLIRITLWNGVDEENDRLLFCVSRLCPCVCSAHWNRSSASSHLLLFLLFITHCSRGADRVSADITCRYGVRNTLSCVVFFRVKLNILCKIM